MVFFTVATYQKGTFHHPHLLGSRCYCTPFHDLLWRPQDIMGKIGAILGRLSSLISHDVMPAPSDPF